jgi:hypothetical protein
METHDTDRINSWNREIFELPKDATINLSEGRGGEDSDTGFYTKIEIVLPDGSHNEFIIKKATSEINHQDIHNLKALTAIKKQQSHPLYGFIFRFLGWWFAFSGIYVMSAICPFCGNQGCLVGAGTAGIVGGILALTMQNWKALIGRLRKVKS